MRNADKTKIREIRQEISNLVFKLKQVEDGMKEGFDHRSNDFQESPQGAQFSHKFETFENVAKTLEDSAQTLAEAINA